MIPDLLPPARETRSVSVLMASTFMAAAAFVAAVALLTGVFSSSEPSRSAGGPVVSRVRDEVVDINTVLPEEDGAAAGTGMVLSSDGEVLTNNHVIQEASTITATDIGNGRTYTATVVGYDEARDIAVLRLEGASGLPTVTLGSSAGVQDGTRVMTVGNAGGLGGTPAAKTGLVTARDESVVVADDLDDTTESLSRLIEIHGDLQPGDSGGPMINRAGRVVGMDTAASASYQFGSGSANGLGFAIEIDPAKQIARRILAGEATSTIHIGTTAFIGVSIESHDTGPPGAPVGAAIPGTAAAAAGLGHGDLIVEFAGKPIDSTSALTTALVPFHPGQHAKLVWLTATGIRHQATIRLGTGPAA